VSQILFLRHSKTIANSEGLLAGGLTNSPLNEEGENIAHKRGIELKSQSFQPSKAFCSTLKRTQQTAAIILDELGVQTNITPLAEFDERRFGDYDGKLFEDALKALQQYGPNPPTMEPDLEFIERVLRGLENIKQLNNDMVLVVAHVNVLSVLHCSIYEPSRMHEYWETYAPHYCQGFTYDY
jgi:broad specificity phosphatase PhoE